MWLPQGKTTWASVMYRAGATSFQIAVGDGFTVGLKADGSVVAVGTNEYGQCDVQDWGDIVMITAGRLHVLGA